MLVRTAVPVHKIEPCHLPLRISFIYIRGSIRLVHHSIVSSKSSGFEWSIHFSFSSNVQYSSSRTRVPSTNRSNWHDLMKNFISFFILNLFGTRKSTGCSTIPYLATHLATRKRRFLQLLYAPFPRHSEHLKKRSSWQDRCDHKSFPLWQSPSFVPFLKLLWRVSSWTQLQRWASGDWPYPARSPTLLVFPLWCADRHLQMWPLCLW